MAKRKKKKKAGLKAVLVYLAIAFTVVLFIIKVLFKGLGWLDVFAPLLVVFFIIFLLSVIKTAVKKV